MFAGLSQIGMPPHSDLFACASLPVPVPVPEPQLLPFLSPSGHGSTGRRLQLKRVSDPCMYRTIPHNRNSISLVPGLSTIMLRLLAASTSTPMRYLRSSSILLLIRHRTSAFSNGPTSSFLAFYVGFFRCSSLATPFFRCPS
jgi:hypothetical protein